MHVAASRQAQIVELGGLKLLLPLTQSTEVEVQRLAVHALANLSVNGENSTQTRGKNVLSVDKVGLVELSALSYAPRQPRHGRSENATLAGHYSPTVVQLYIAPQKGDKATAPCTVSLRALLPILI